MRRYLITRYFPREDLNERRRWALICTLCMWICWEGRLHIFRYVYKYIFNIYAFPSSVCPPPLQWPQFNHKYIQFTPPSHLCGYILCSAIHIFIVGSCWCGGVECSEYVGLFVLSPVKQLLYLHFIFSSFVPYSTLFFLSIHDSPTWVMGFFFFRCFLYFNRIQRYLAVPVSIPFALLTYSIFFLFFFFTLWFLFMLVVFYSTMFCY